MGCADRVAFDAEPSAWVAVASTDGTHFRSGITRGLPNLGEGLRTALGVRLGMCPAEHPFDVRLDLFTDVTTWRHHEDGKAAFGGLGLQIELDFPDVASARLGLHAGVSFGEAFSPFGAANPFRTYEAGVRMRVSDVKVGVDAFTAPGPLSSHGVVVSVGPTGSIGRWSTIAFVVATLWASGAVMRSPPTP